MRSYHTASSGQDGGGQLQVTTTMAGDFSFAASRFWSFNDGGKFKLIATKSRGSSSWTW